MKKYIFIFFIVIVFYSPIIEAMSQNQELPSIDSLWNYSQLEETEQRFQEALEQAKKLKDTAYQTEILTQIARTYSLRGKFEEAHSFLKQSADICEDTFERAKVRYHLEKGRAWNSAGDKTQAKEEFIQAYNLADTNNELDYFTVDAAHMVAIASMGTDEEFTWTKKAIAIAEKSTNKRTRKWLAALYNNLGWSYHDNKRYDEALEIFEKALEFRRSMEDAKGTFIARWTIGRTYRSMNDITKALSIQMELLQEIRDGKAWDNGYVFEEIGECLLLQEKQEEAQPYFAKAYEILSKDSWLQKNEAERLGRLKKLGEL